MKRKLVLAHEASSNPHEEEPESKKGKMTSHTPALLMLPYEMLGLICGFVDQIDGLRFASSCRALYRSLYENHESFMSHRMINEMKTLLTKYDRSTTKYQPHISTSIVPIMPFEKVLRFTVDNVVEDSMNQFRLNLLWNEKHKEWNRFLSNKIAPKYGVDVAKLVSANLLEKCQLISSSTDTVLNCRILKATIKIGLLKFEHYAEEVQNTETNNEKNVIWNMKVFTPGEPWGFEFANAEGDTLTLRLVARLREILELDEITLGRELCDRVTPRAIIDTLLAALPWDTGFYMSRAKKIKLKNK